MIDNDDNDDDMIIIAVSRAVLSLTCDQAVFLPFFGFPRKKIKRLITVYFFAVAIWPRYFFSSSLIV